MKRVLKFGDDDKSKGRFVRLYQAMASQPAKERSLDAIRKEAGVLNKLDAISEEKPDGRQLIPGSVLELTVSEHSLLVAGFDKVAWPPAWAVSVADAADFLDSAEKIEE